jgi:membrane protease YdiL (CAAX protease family)
MTLLPVAPQAPVRPDALRSVDVVPEPGAPLAFHRLARTGPGRRWWRPLLVLLLASVTYAVLGLGVLFALLALDLVAGTTWSTRAVAESFTDPLTFGFGFASIALMMPALLLALRLAGPRPVGLVFSVAGGVRWRWLGSALWRAAAVHVVAFALLLLVVDPATGVPAAFSPRPGAIAFLVLAVLVVPFQAAAEELVFRGFAMQTVGTWLRHPAFAVLLPVPFFVVGHPYDVWGQLEVGVFAVVAGWLAWRTGGLEASVALHVVNNVLLSVLAAFGLADLDATQGSPLSLVSSTLTTLVTAVWLLRAFRAAGQDRAVRV